MIRIALLLWALFLIILGVSMMPTTMIIAVVIGGVGGVISAIIKHNEKKKEKPNFELYEWEKYF